MQLYFFLRETEEELVLTCKLNIHIKFAHKHLAYKYVVKTESDVFFEKLDSVKRKGKHLNRCLLIIPDSLGKIYLLSI